VHRVRIEAAGIGRVGEVVDAVKEPGRLAGDHDDRPGGPEPHDFVRGQQGPPLDVFAGCSGEGAGLEAPCAVRRPARRLEADRALAEGIADVSRGVVVGGAEELLTGVGEEALPSRIDGFELRQVLDEQPELGAVAAQQSDVVGQAVDTAELAELIEEEGDASGRLARRGADRIEGEADGAWPVNVPLQSPDVFG
jgi:hypothetical protein